MSTKEKTPKAKPKAAKAAARKPVTYTREMGLMICEEVAMRRPLAEVCAEPGMPSERTVYTWRRSHPVFAADYEEARKWRAEARVDFIDGIAQRLEAKEIDPQTARTLFDIERWQAAKEAPGRYSEKTTTELTGKDGAAIQIANEPEGVEVARRISFLLGRGLIQLEALQAKKRIEGQVDERSEG
jgi:hypothetical protein